MNSPDADTPGLRGSAVDIPQALRPAVGLLAAEPARAEAFARAFLAGAPQDPGALLVLGTALRVQGASAEAIAVLEPLAQSQPGAWVPQFELGQALFADRRTRDAVAPLSRAVELNPGLAAAWRLLGDIATVAGDVAGAQAAYDRFLVALIRDPRLAGAAQAFADGRFEAAEVELRSVLARDGGAMAAAHLLGEALRRRGRLAEAEALLAQCVQRWPEFHLARQSLALVLLGSGKAAEALEQLGRLGEADPGDNRTRMMRAAALSATGDYAAAAEVTSSVLERFPDQPQGWMVHGNGLRTLGRLDEAVAAYLRCLELDPGFSQAYWSLANLKTYRLSAETCATIEERLAQPGAAPADRSNLHFTLGKVREDDGRYAEAFEHYVQGNAAQRELGGYDPARTSDFVRRCKVLFTREFFQQRAGWGAKGDDPIFILGLPRSGSTLVDQILASHSEVEGTRELQEIQEIADWIALQGDASGVQGYPEPLGSMPRDFSVKLGADYLNWTRPLRRSGRPHFTDKAPWNFQHIGLIQLILPNAKIIDVRRHPLGCGLSIFKQHFSSGFDFSYDLSDIGRYYADYVELMTHYDAVLPGRVHRVVYERLVEDTEDEVRRLLDYLGLAFEPGCLKFFDNPRAVATPSSEQVRRPIFTEGVDQWRRFEPWLGPLKTALGPVLDAYPEPPAYAAVQSAG